jgi:sulfite reductase alpha subunit-like flavoprotein
MFLICVRNNSYAPGDIATIHPFASSTEIEAFLDMMNWGDIADMPFEIGCAMQGMLFLPLFPPEILSLLNVRSVTP